jgi:hypothetical protein
VDGAVDPADGGRADLRELMAMLDSARRGVRVPALVRWLLGLGIAARLVANVAHGLGQGPATDVFGTMVVQGQVSGAGR